MGNVGQKAADLNFRMDARDQAPIDFQHHLVTDPDRRVALVGTDGSDLVRWLDGDGAKTDPRGETNRHPTRRSRAALAERLQHRQRELRAHRGVRQGPDPDGVGRRVPIGPQRQKIALDVGPLIQVDLDDTGQSVAGTWR
ncbi:MAG: hypothetical protein H7840_05205 [Alphaproteobacteria bacterium]